MNQFARIRSRLLNLTKQDKAGNTLSRVKNIKKQTNNRFLNIYELESVKRDGGTIPYYLASRSPSIEELKLYKKENPADAVMICAVAGDKLVLEKQYRFTIDDYIYELPAGLIEKGETLEIAAKRELFEETGMSFTPLHGHHSSRPYFSSIGMTDESIATVYGYASGVPTSEHEEATEDIHVVLADRRECVRILKEEYVATMAAFLMMNFINSPVNPFQFLV